MPLRYSTGCVRDYIANCGAGPDLPLTIPEGANFRFWYDMAGFQLFTRWENGDVWGSDFRDGTDLAADGGSDVPEIYLFSGHGFCENPPNATSGDFIVVCGNFGKPDATNIGSQSRWGNNGGRLRFAFIDASCPMDLVELSNSWFPCFQGLHMTVGFSGDINHDCLDSANRGGQFAALTVDPLPWPFPPQLSVGDAWMQAGLIDIQSGCCAVALAAGNDRNDAIDRRENERVTDNRPDPTPNWFAWKWVCA
jgi:Family of unknown function (DUF6345)